MCAREELNEKQKEAVAITEGPLLIIAGAGAGKTKTLTHRIIHLIERGVAHENILAVTFTNKAAQEMRERMRTCLDDTERQPLISTFHSLCVRILRENAAVLGYPRHFSILDKEDSLALLKRAMEELGISLKEQEPRKILAVISREKNNLVSQEIFAGRAQDTFRRMVAAVWSRYRALVKKSHSFDFDDLIASTVALFAERPDILAKYQERWRYIHVDEYQDTNTAQYELVFLLAKKYRNLAVVGDADQSIYGWRGADFKNILNFESDYPGATVVVLEENYRSTQTIIAAANEVIKKNRERRDKSLFTKNKVGEKIGLITALNEAGEARGVAEKAGELIRRKKALPRDIAVLYRANFQSRAMEEAFLSRGLPYQVFGIRFFERKEIKDMLAYLRAALNHNDTESIKRIINTPRRGLGKASMAKILSGASHTLPRAAARGVENFFSLLAAIKERLQISPLSETLKFILTESGWERELEGGGEEGVERLENLRELVSIARGYDALLPSDALESFLTDAALLSAEEAQEEERAENEGVRLMTVHAAKGLEFGYVFVTGLEQELFPHTRVSASASAEREYEEERRLFYVAITRAKEKLYLSYAQTRTIYGSRRINITSEFLLDISDDLIEEELFSPMDSEDVIEWD